MVPAPAERVARNHYEDRQLLAARATAAAVRSWSQIDVDDIAASWALEVPALTARVAAAQRTAAAAADGYVTAVLDAQGVAVAADAELVAAGFAGVASDGRSLRSLLAHPAISTLTRIGAGFTVGEALESGRAALTMVVGTQIADAGRVADGVAITTRPQVGYTRMLNPPSCSRCAVLAGRRYRWNAGFQRHPRCDCTHIPSLEDLGDDLRTDPRRYFRSLSTVEQDRIFTADAARAIRDGADVGQVVNARRGMTAAGTTTTGTTRRALASRRPRGRERLMPERIYQLADGDRDTALSLLRQHGFIA